MAIATGGGRARRRSRPEREDRATVEIVERIEIPRAQFRLGECLRFFVQVLYLQYISLSVAEARLCD